MHHYEQVEKIILDNLAAEEQRMEDAERRGLERGMEKGMERRSIEIAKAMLAQRLSVKVITQVTGLPKKEVAGLE